MHRGRVFDLAKRLAAASAGPLQPLVRPLGRTFAAEHPHDGNLTCCRARSSWGIRL